MNSLNVIIETPKGSNVKYHVEEKTRFISLKKFLPAGMMFPFDFGYLPGTKGEDGDPLDVLVISEFSCLPSCSLECRIIGGFQALQSREAASEVMIRNDRFFAIPLLSVMYKDIGEISDIPKAVVKETEQFFIQYNKIGNKKFSILRTFRARQAMKTINSNTSTGE